MKEHKLITWCEELHLVKGNMSQLLATVTLILQKTPSSVEYNNLCLALGISPKAPAVIAAPAAAKAIEVRVRNLVQSPQLKAALHLKHLYESGGVPALKLLALINFKSGAASSTFKSFLEYEPTIPAPHLERDNIADDSDLPVQKSIGPSDYPPALPPISDPLLLIRVFTDKSYLSCAELLSENACNGYNAKMSIRGRAIIDLVLYALMDDTLSSYDESQIFRLHARLTSDTMLAKLAVAYSMPRQSRHQISVDLSDAVKLSIFANLFASYVCALQIDGYSFVSLERWISQVYGPALNSASARVAQTQPYGAELALMFPTTDPNHKRILYVQLEKNPFVSRVYIDEYPFGTGTSSRSLAEAEARAASNTIENEEYMLVLRQDLCDEGMLQCPLGQVKGEYLQSDGDDYDHSEHDENDSDEYDDEDGNYSADNSFDDQHHEESHYDERHVANKRNVPRKSDHGSERHESPGHASTEYQDENYEPWVNQDRPALQESDGPHNTAKPYKEKATNTNKSIPYSQQSSDYSSNSTYDYDLPVQKKAKKNSTHHESYNSQSPMSLNSSASHIDLSAAASTGGIAIEQSPYEEYPTPYDNGLELLEQVSQRYQNFGCDGSYTGLADLQELDMPIAQEGSQPFTMNPGDDLVTFLKAFEYEPSFQVTQTKNGFHTRAYVGNTLIGSCTNPSKATAEKNASANALRALAPEGNHILFNGRMLLRGKNSKLTRNDQRESSVEPPKSAPASEHMISAEDQHDLTSISNARELSVEPSEPALLPNTRESFAEPLKSEWRDSIENTATATTPSRGVQSSTESVGPAAHLHSRERPAEEAETSPLDAYFDASSMGLTEESPQESQNQECQWHDPSNSLARDENCEESLSRQSNADSYNDKCIDLPKPSRINPSLSHHDGNTNTTGNSQWDLLAVESIAATPQNPLTSAQFPRPLEAEASMY